MGLWSYCTARHGARHYGRENTFVAITILLLLSLLAPATSPALAADAPGTATAPVVVDGATLFRVRGLSAYPADERASVIADRVRAAAADRGAAIDTLRVVPGERSSDIVMGDDPIMSVFEADAEVEGFHRDDLARWYARRIRGAVEAYRRDRSPRNLLAAAGASLAATVVLAGAVLVLIRFWRRLNLILESRYTRRLRSLEIQSVQVIHAERLHEPRAGNRHVRRVRARVGSADVPDRPHRHHRVRGGDRLSVHPGVGVRRLQGHVDLLRRALLARGLVGRRQHDGGILADLSPDVQGR